jgi:uncharacterized protein YdeI (YjbR/CyaY-like superfamily)
MDNPSVISPKNKLSLRRSLEAGKFSLPLWVEIYKKSSGKQTLSYDEVVEEAICFGLIDTQTKGTQQECYAICLRARRPGSNWTKTNKAIAKKMVEQGRMTKKGQKTLGF